VNDAKYIGLDVHQATFSATVLDSAGKLVMESILETKAATILQFIRGLRDRPSAVGCCAVIQPASGRPRGHSGCLPTSHSDADRRPPLS
jgi:hypothetical protein